MTSSQVAVIVVASFAGALVKAVTGLGYPVIAIPFISLAIGVEDAVVMVAVPNFAANAFLCWEAREARHEARDLDLLIGFGIVGAIVGTIALVELPEEPLLVLLAATIVVFIVRFLRDPHLRWAERTARRGAPFVGLAVGLLQGAIGVSGPVVATWIHGYRLAARTYIFTITLIFGVTGLAQIAVLGAQGRFTGERIAGAAVAGVAVALATAVGLRLRSRLAGPTFERAVLAALALSAVSLLVDAFR
ncbi:MAG: sulfite exporter TauE/SafE family protein [Acidimicrobiales bacterium]|nr:sulfite exporter TauE/SafE family protein [Acidimicrobiales bacterium]HRW38034.1 sulfite exporter TauE/SafE family protein [Aquihabitans sp.]